MAALAKSLPELQLSYTAKGKAQRGTNYVQIDPEVRCIITGLPRALAQVFPRSRSCRLRAGSPRVRDLPQANARASSNRWCSTMGRCGSGRLARARRATGAGPWMSR